MKWQKREPVIEPRKNSSIIDNLARIRGIKDIIHFLNPTKRDLYSPYDLANIKEASEMIIQAILKGKRICVSADCDSDGVMSTGMFMRYVRQLTDNIYYIFNQRDDGHGIENQLHLVEDGTDLVVILDSSTNSVKACKQLRERGIDVIILDHHQVSANNPHAILVNPQNDNYPNKHLSGAGVTFKCLQVLDEKLDIDNAFEYIDLCAIGMYGDLMRVDVMENRYLIIEGMKNINNPGVQAILEVKGIKPEDVNSGTLGFSIVPLINGCSRMGKIELALELVLCDDYMECFFIAEQIDKLNEERKYMQKYLSEEYSKSINFDNKILIGVGEMASKSFNGLIATNISNEHKKPTLILKHYKGSLAGSYRTYGDFNVQKFLRKCPYIEYAEGHTFAGGVKLFAKDLGEFIDYINENLKDVVFDDSIKYDIELDISQITEEILLEVEKFDYLSGQGFPSATFRIKGIMYDKDGRKIVGKNNDTLKMQLDDVTIMKFSVKEDYALDIPDMAEIEVVGGLNLNVYVSKYGKEYRTNQIFLDDYSIKK